MKQTSQLPQNKIPKQLNQYIDWKNVGTKKSAEFFPKNQLEMEFSMGFN